MDRNISQINAAIDSIIARVNSIDGQSLADPGESVVNQISREIEGLRETVNQAVLTLDSHLTSMDEELANLKALLYQHLGLPQ